MTILEEAQMTQTTIDGRSDKELKQAAPKTSEGGWEEQIRLVLPAKAGSAEPRVKMFSDELIREAEKATAKWEESAMGMGLGGIPQAQTWSGIKLKPVYTPLDIKDLAFEMPGQYPLTRGNSPLHYQVNPVMMNQGYGMETTADTRKRSEFLRKIGMRLHAGNDDDVTPFINLIDLPSQRGLDPDDERSRGRVGECGMSVSTVDDYADLLDGADLERTLTLIIAFDAIIPQIALHSAYVLDKRKEPLAKTFHMCCNLPYHQWFWDSIGFPPRTAMKLQTEVMKWGIENSPNTYGGLMDGYNVAEAGAPPALEVALNLANMIEFIEYCIKAGLKPDDVASRVWVHPHLSVKLYEEVAKIRASRRLWARIMKERFGCSTPKALAYKTFLGQGAGADLPGLEIHNNIIRVTVMAMAGMFSDVDGMWLPSYDEALGIPVEKAAQVAVRTYQILHDETDIAKVTDPFGGSYFMESLTNSMEEEILNILKKMDEMGGYLKCWESGWIRSEVERHANKRFRKIDSGEWPVFGLNKYRVEEDSDFEAFRRRPEVEEIAIQRVKKYREERDQERTNKALQGVRHAAQRIVNNWPESCGELFAASTEAARAKATLGEIHSIYREVFGFGYYSD